MTTQTDESTDGGPPNAPGYREFRMAAAWASAIRGVHLNLEYEHTTGRMHFAGKPTDTPPLLTPPNAPRPAVQHVEMTFPGASAPWRFDGDRYSALLWSESAVEKFLFPYYASAEADNAARFMARVSNAWYGYPGRVVQVCALAVRPGTAAGGGELSLDATAELVCVERAKRTLAVMSLSDFERTYPSGAARGAAPAGMPGDAVPCGDGWKVGANEVNSIVAREAAEFVSGLRGHYVWLTLDGGKLTPWICPTEQPGAPPPDRRVFASGVATAVRGDRPPPSEVTLRVEGRRDHHTVVGPTIDPTTVPDSIFWSDGAVEKLVLPYYASVKGRDAPFFACLLMGKWDGLIGAGCCDTECALTALRGLLPRQPGEARPAGDPIAAPFAVTHLPRSEYVSDAGGGFSAVLEHRTRLLVAGPGGIEDHPLYGSPDRRPAG